MQKVNKIIKIVAAMLLSLTLVTSCLVSGVFAKYVKKGEATFQSIELKKWGLTVSSKGTDLKKEYTSDGNVIVKSSTSINSGNDNIIMPGSSGRLAYFRIEGSPEVAYSVDFSGSIDIGDGFKKYIRDSEGQLIDYFPIILRFVAYDVSVVDDKEVFTEVAELTSPLITVKRTDVWGNEHYFDDNALESIDLLETLMNSDSDISLNKALDELYLAPGGTSINRIYALEWEWLYHYDTVEEVEAGKTENNREATASGNYQTKELDTQLGEAIVKKYNEFNISVDMDVTVKQLTGEVPYELFTEDGVEKIKFGSYPQSLVSDSDLATTLSTKAGTLPTAAESYNWTSYGYYKNGSNSEDYMWYIDIEEGEDKYRGVYFTEYRSNSVYNQVSESSTSTPENIQFSNTYQDNYGYYPSNVYWFRYDPISWTIIEETSQRNAFIVCDMMIDAQAYQNEYESNENRHYNTSDGVPIGTYANNYAYSTIRKWLNETFYDTAFSNFQKQLIFETYVDNSKASAGYSYAVADKICCENTLDRMFLLSYVEASKIETADRLKKITEYALSQGGYWNKPEGESDDYWWLRSFALHSEGDTWTNTWAALFVNFTGALKYLTGENMGTSATYLGIVPAMWINLK